MSGIVNDITGVGEAVTGVSAIADTVTNTLFKIWPGLDHEGVAKAAQELQEKIMDQQAGQDHDQSEVNKVEAASSSLFVAGWRPFLGWVCGAGFAWAFVIGPMFAMFVRVWKYDYALPVLDTGSLIALVGGMLGLGTLKTVEHLNGVPQVGSTTTTTKQIRKATAV